MQAEPRQTQFTGSTKVAEMLTEILKGKIKIEGGGFDWKLLGPDVPTNPQLFDLVAVQCDQVINDQISIFGDKFLLNAAE